MREDTTVTIATIVLLPTVSRLTMVLVTMLATGTCVVRDGCSIRKRNRGVRMV